MNLPLSEKAKEIIANDANWRACSPDNPPCGNCKNIIWDAPFRVFREMNGKMMEIAFHLTCAFESGSVYPDEERDPLPGEDPYCFYCDDFDTCPHVSEAYKGKKRESPEDLK